MQWSPSPLRSLFFFGNSSHFGGQVQERVLCQKVNLTILLHDCYWHFCYWAMVRLLDVTAFFDTLQWPLRWMISHFHYWLVCHKRHVCIFTCLYTIYFSLSTWSLICTQVMFASKYLIQKYSGCQILLLSEKVWEWKVWKRGKSEARTVGVTLLSRIFIASLSLYTLMLTLTVWEGKKVLVANKSIFHIWWNYPGTTLMWLRKSKKLRQQLHNKVDVASLATFDSIWVEPNMVRRPVWHRQGAHCWNV